MSIRLLPFVLCAALIAGCSRAEDAAAEAEAAAAAEPQALTAAHLADLIAADGAAHTFAVLTGPADPTGIDKVFAGIATGDPEWLALVPAIEPLTDGMYAEGLQDALRNALVPNTAGVLGLMPDYGSYYFVCADADREAARPLVAAIADPALRAARDRCLDYMDADETQLEALEAA
jgi:hypothetical protein